MQIAGIVFATQWKGIIPLDGNGEVLRRAIIWLDGRAGEQAKALSKRMGRAYSARDYWPRLMWFREVEPALYEKTACILEVNGYLKYKACGKYASDVTNHFTKSPLPGVQSLFDEIMRASGLDAKKFPPVVSPAEQVGTLTDAAAQEMGLAQGIPVFGGLCDIPAVAVGAGACAVGAGHLYLGSSGWFGLMRSIQDALPGVPMLLGEDRWLDIAGMQSACMTYDWCIDTFYKAEKAQLGAEVYGLVEKELSRIPAGSENLLSLPLQYGESAPFPPTMRASFVGVGAAHTRAHFVNATLEGISCIFRMRKEMIERRSGRKVTILNVVGGGSENSHWMQMLANILQVEVNVPENARYAGALGAACCAMIGLGLHPNFDECSCSIPIGKRFTPNPAAQDVYAAYPDRWEGYLNALTPMETGR